MERANKGVKKGLRSGGLVKTVLILWLHQSVAATMQISRIFCFKTSISLKCIQCCKSILHLLR